MNAQLLVTTDLLALARQAALEIPPLFSLDRFVATNPFLGHAAQPYAEAARALALTRGAKLMPSRDAVRQAIASGELTDADIAAALAAHQAEAGPGAVAAIKLALAAPASDLPPMLPTAAGLLHRTGGGDWSSFVVDKLSLFCAGAAASNAASEPDTLLAAWRDELDHDLSASAAGLAGIETHLRQLPRSTATMLAVGHTATGLTTDQFALYLKRLLADLAGWSGFWRGREWDRDQQSPGLVLDLLAMRLGWEIALIARTPAVADHLHDHIAAAVNAEQMAQPSLLDTILQDALENAWRRRLFGRLAAPPLSTVVKSRDALQAVFCIDVRSEPLRRALEAQDTRISTGGFAGFFGLPLEIKGDAEEVGSAHCPALIAPSLVATSTTGDGTMVKKWNDIVDGAARGPLTSLGLVETLGLGYALKHMAAAIAPAFGKADAVTFRKPAAYVLGHADGREIGLSEKADLAAAMLRGMGLSGEIAPVVVLVGHGASTVNNAHAASLHCGACGGHSGEANAVVAALLLGDPLVRTELAARGLPAPDDTVFVPALHDTTTNRITILVDPAAGVSASLQQAVAWFAAACSAVTRPTSQPILPGTAQGRAQDWSAVRPEWGLAGCAAFIAGPRAATRGVDLEGSAFLHSYDWRTDAGFAVLEQILTAPLVVASWINLQYFAATRDNARFGGGNKLIHNVVAGIGVIEGAGGDLRLGLPLQSLHDGTDYVHAPLRLTALIEAPAKAILTVIGRHAHLRHLLDNHWISLFRTESGAPVARYVSGLRWLPIGDTPARGA